MDTPQERKKHTKLFILHKITHFRISLRFSVLFGTKLRSINFSRAFSGFGEILGKLRDENNFSFHFFCRMEMLEIKFV